MSAAHHSRHPAKGRERRVAREAAPVHQACQLDAGRQRFVGGMTPSRHGEVEDGNRHRGRALSNTNDSVFHDQPRCRSQDR
jgi:hypothetical protein